ncbi:MAG: hypothetical protein AB8F94_11930 [Saprospiraceae bacterium]
MEKSINLNSSSHSTFLKNTISKISQRFPFLHRIVFFHFLLLLICCIGMMVDDRQLMGINVWIKPTKFIISGIIVLWTMAWYLLVYPFREKTKNFIAVFIAMLMVLENIIVTVQAGRGVSSHYNQSNLLDGIAFAMMGIMIGLFTGIVFWFFVKSFSPQLKFSKPMKWSFRIAWFTFLFASIIGGQMIGQMSHNVGVADGGVGLPFLNWSTVGGDLRVAHFFGIHGIQIIPLAAFYFATKTKNNTTLTNVLSIGFALLYLGWIAFTFYQAKQGIPLLSL